MTKNPYFNPDPAQHWHGDEMFESLSRDATLQDTWYVWQSHGVDCDFWSKQDWADDIRRSDFFNDMNDECLFELMRMIATHRKGEHIKNLAQHAKDYIEETLGA